MIVSLEAIFLSTFVMISQNRADARRQVIADEQWKMVQEEDKQNQELLENQELLGLSRQILALTKEVHSLADPTTPGSFEGRFLDLRRSASATRPAARVAHFP
jgi:uncharacterized membrane protein